MATKMIMLDMATSRKVAVDAADGVIVDAGEAIPANSFVYFKLDSGVWKAFVAKGDSYDTRAMGFVSTTTASGDPVGVIVAGIANGLTDLDTKTITGDLFLLKAGSYGAVSDAAAVNDIVQKLGTRIGAGSIVVSIEEAITLA